MSENQQNRLAPGSVLAIAAASAGAMFVWYDLFLFTVLAPVIGAQFFSTASDAASYLCAMLVFAAGFVMRPLGALVFGRSGDLQGRRKSLVVSTFVVVASSLIIGLLPAYGAAGIVAPIALVALRLIQGLALGGQLGGSATYVAELAPAGRRGLFTSFVQVAAPAALVLALAATLVIRSQLGEAKFAEWGWRAPFLVSAILLGLWAWLRLKLHESPVFEKLAAEGRTSHAPLAESLARWPNLKIILLALLGLTAGQAVVWQTGLVYSLTFLTQNLRVDPVVAGSLLIIALLLGAPFFVLFGWLSDRIGRKWIIMAGCALAAATCFPLFQGLTWSANPRLVRAQASAVVVVVADPGNCSVQFDPGGKAMFATSCDIAKAYLTRSGVPYRNEAAYPGVYAGVQVGDCANCYVDSFDGRRLSAHDFKAARTDFEKKLGSALLQAGYPARADPALVNKPLVIGILFVLVLYAAMVGGPLAAMLAEQFPARLRYTSTGVAYHLGGGWFGGLMPAVVFSMIAVTGNLYGGLWWVVFIAALAVIVGGINLADTRKADIQA